MVYFGLLFDFLCFGLLSLKIIWGDTFNTHIDLHVLALVSILVLLNVFYFWGIKHAHKFKTKSIWLFGIAAALILTPILKFPSDDLMTYVSRGRMMSLYGANPYLVTYDTLSEKDPFYSELKTVWSNDLDIYGPAVHWFYGGIALISVHSLIFTFMLSKVLALTLFILTAYLIYKITKSKLSLYLFLFNPFLLFELIANAHVDLLVVFFLVVSLYFLNNKSNFLSWAFFTLSILTKYIPVFLMPFFIVFITRKTKTISGFIKFWVLSIALSLSLAAFLYAPFWEGFQIFKYLMEFTSVKSITPAPLIFILDLFLSFHHSYRLSQLVFVLLSLLAFIAFSRGSHSVSKFSWWIALEMIIFFATIPMRLVSWYFTVPLALLTISYTKEQKKVLWALLGITLYCLVFWVRIR